VIRASVGQDEFVLTAEIGEFRRAAASTTAGVDGRRSRRPLPGEIRLMRRGTARLACPVQPRFPTSPERRKPASVGIFG